MKILYIFTGGRKKRIKAVKKGDAPSDFFFGALEMEKLGHDVDIMEMDEIKSKPPFFREIKNKCAEKISGLNLGTGVFRPPIEKLNAYDHIICGNDYVALCLYPLKKSGALEPPFSFFAMGQLAKTDNPNLPKWRRKIGQAIYGNLIKYCHTAFFLGQGEFNLAKKLYGRSTDKLAFLPFGIDTGFWKPDAAAQEENFILSVGNDKARDWRTAIAAARLLPEENFKFVTKNGIFEKSDLPKNIEVIKGDWKNGYLTDIEIRSLYRRCKAVILPIKETLQPSGQSVCLQAMACGKPVIISDYAGFWDKGRVKDKIHLIINRDCASGFARAVKELGRSEKTRQNIGSAAAALVTDRYATAAFAASALQRVNNDN